MSEQQMKVTDLRSALVVLSQYDDELIYTDEPVDPIAELSGVYRYVGAHGTVQRPTRVGPAMIYVCAIPWLSPGWAAMMSPSSRYWSCPFIV